MDVNKEVFEIINSNTLVKINNNLYLKKYQIDILDLNHIEYKNATNISEILFYINEAILNGEVDNLEMLEEVASSLQEFHYYNYTNK